MDNTELPKLPEPEPKKIPPGLIPWKPGQSGNPKGRPKSLSTFVDELLTKTDDLRAVADQLVFCIAQEYDLKAKIAACRVILEYCVGKPSQPVEITGKLSLEQIIAQSYQDRMKQGA